MEAMQLMPVHRTNMLIQTFNQPKFEVETPVETIETEIISSRRENKRLPFIEANTKEVTIQHLREECVVPVFSKDNEITISHPSFIETVWEAANQIFPNVYSVNKLACTPYTNWTLSALKVSGTGLNE